MNTEQLIEKSQQYLVDNYGRLPIAMSHGKGSEIWDSDGKRYIDFFAGFGACSIAGHCDERLVATLKSQSEKLLSHGNFFTSQPQIELAEKIVKHSFPAQVFFSHSGAEANEAAIKLSRKAADKGRYKIICFENCFHGRTMGALSITPEAFQLGFEPMLEGAIRVPFGDLDAVQAAVDSQTAAVFVEPIQGEGGVNIPSKEFMQGLRKVCDENNILMVCDEVWTAPARTGKWFAYQHYGITPDVMTLAKAIGGGLPLAATVISNKWSDAFGPGSHGCTLGGNPACASVSLAALKIIEDESLEERAGKIGTEVLQTLDSKKPDCLKDVRGIGMMIALELDEKLAPMDIVKECLKQGLFIAPAKRNSIRLAPPLNIDKAILDEGIQILLNVLNEK